MTDPVGFSIPALPADETPQKPRGFTIGAPAPDAKERGFLDNAPDDTSIGGTLKNFGSGLIDAATGVVGQFGDMDDFTGYAAQRLKSFTSGKPLEQVKAERAALEKDINENSWISKTLGWKMGRSLPNSAEVRKALVPDAVGNYEPQTEEGKLGRTLVTVLPSVLAPGKLAGATPTMTTARDALRTSVKATPMVALGTTAAHAATEYSDDPLVGALAGILTPMAAAKVTPLVARANPFKDTRTETGRRLNELATDAPAAEAAGRASPRTATDAPTETFGQSSGDKGVLVTEHRAQSLHDRFRTGLSDLYDQQNTTRRRMVEDLERGGDPATVARVFNEHLDQLGTFHDVVVTAAERQAQAAANSVPRGTSDTAGGGLRDNLNRFKTEMRGVRNEAYRLVDPDGTLVVPSTDLIAHGQAVLDARPQSAPAISARTQEAFDAVGRLDPRAAPYTELRALDANINEAAREANLAGRAGDERLLGQLKNGVRRSLDNAVENHAAQNAEAVARGTIPVEMSFENQLRDSIASWQQRQQAAMGVVGDRATGTVGAGSTTHTRPSGEAGEGNAGPTAGRGDTDIPGSVPTPFDTDARARLNNANRINGQFQTDYKQGPVAAILKSESGMANDFKLTGADVTSKAFVPGKGGYETANRIMGAGGHGPEIVADMRNIATAELRAAMDKNGGTLSQHMLDTWRNKYADALRAVDEASPGFSASFNNVAAAHTAIDQAAAARTTQIRDFEQGAARRFLGKEHPDDVINAVGDVISGKSSGQQTQQLMTALQADPAALAGVRRSGVEWMLRQFSNAGVQGGEHTVSAAKLMKFIESKPDTIRLLYGDAGHDNMQSLLQELQRRQQNYTTVKTAGSDTASKAAQHMSAANSHAAQQAGMEAAGHFNTLQLLASFRPFAAAASALGNLTYRRFMGALRERNIVRPNDLMMEALLDPRLASTLMQEARTSRAGQPQWGRQIINAIDQVEEAGREVSDPRRQRASGGRISIDHAAEASKYVRMAARAKNAHAKDTEGFLKMPDATVAKALAVAYEAI